MGLPATPSSLTPLSKASSRRLPWLSDCLPPADLCHFPPCAALPSFPASPSPLHLSLLGSVYMALLLLSFPLRSPRVSFTTRRIRLVLSLALQSFQHLLPAFSGAKHLYFSFILKCLAPDPWFARKLTSRHWGNDNNNSTVSGLLLLEAHMHSIRVISLASQQLCKPRE